MIKSPATSPDNFNYSFNLKAIAVIEELNSSGQKIGQGTRKIENDILSAHYQ